jgi:hypothetical protein
MFCEETKLLLASTLPTIAMQYGAEGFSHSESLRALHQEQRKIFAHLIKQEQEFKGDNTNVLPFTGDKS